MDTPRSNTPDALLVDIAKYVQSFAPGDEALSMARLCLSDAIACALDALDDPECTKLLGPLVRGTSVPNGARVPGTPYVLDPATAAFDLTAMIRWLDYNDAVSGAFTTHPSDSIGALLMLADHISRIRVSERKSPLMMRDVLEAMVKTYEIQGALGALNDFRSFGMDQSLLTRVATTPVLTRMLGGNDDEVFNAVSNAFVDSSLVAIRHAPNIGSRKNWATADAMFSAVRLAFMATKGEAGYPWILSAREFGFYDARCKGEPLKFDGRFGESVIKRVMFKLIPAGMHGQSAAECAFRLHETVRDRIEQIDTITLRCHKTLMRIMNKEGPLRNSADRDHCVQYIVAVGLLNGKIDAQDFNDAHAADPRIDALRAKMNIVEEPRFTHDFFDTQKRSSANAVEVRFNDGSTVNAQVEYPPGHARRRSEGLPMLAAKFERAMRRRFDPKRAERVLDGCRDESRLVSLPVNEFVDLLSAG